MPSLKYRSFTLIVPLVAQATPDSISLPSTYTFADSVLIPVKLFLALSSTASAITVTVLLFTVWPSNSS